MKTEIPDVITERAVCCDECEAPLQHAGKVFIPDSESVGLLRGHEQWFWEGGYDQIGFWQVNGALRSFERTTGLEIQLFRDVVSQACGQTLLHWSFAERYTVDCSGTERGHLDLAPRGDLPTFYREKASIESLRCLKWDPALAEGGGEVEEIHISDICRGVRGKFFPNPGLLSNKNRLKPDAGLLAPLVESEIPNAVDVVNILPDSFAESPVVIEVPDYAFLPDEWSKAFLRGLEKLNVEGEHLMEVGVGTGVNAIYLLGKKPRLITITDIDSRNVPLACRNILRHCDDDQIGRVNPYSGSFDLLDDEWFGHTELIEQGAVDVVLGCLPQVVVPPDVDIHDGCGVAHYYDSEQYQDCGFGVYGLTLNNTFLRQVREKIDQESGRVVLNLGGRPGKETLDRLFTYNGFAPQILHEEVILQHPGTKIDTLVAIEKLNNISFEFFSDADGQSQITAVQAAELIEEGENVYHKIYVYQGTINNN